MNRLRPVAYVVQPQYMIDDGEVLRPLPVQPVTILAADWASVLEIVGGAEGQLRQQVEGSAGGGG